jgi:hypothetical protein
MEEDVKEIYVSKIIEEDGEIVMLFQPDLLKKMNFRGNTLWQWEPQENGSIILSQVGEV